MPRKMKPPSRYLNEWNIKISMNQENPCGKIMINEYTFSSLEYPKPLFENDSKLINKPIKKQRRRINLRKD